MGKNLILIFYQDFFRPKSMKQYPTITLFLAFSFLVLHSKGQFFDFGGSRVQAMATTSVGSSGLWSTSGNQAGLANLSNPEIAVAFQNRFLVPDLSDRIALFAFPFQSNVFALSFYQFGDIPFRQEKIGLAYARHISPKISFGLQFSYFRFYLPEANRSAVSAGMELGFQYQAGPKLNLGLHVTNPYQTEVKTYTDQFKYPSQIKFGFQYNLSEACLWASETEYEFRRRFRLKTGLEYDIREKLFLRIGIATNPYLLSSGIGFRVRRMSVDFGNSFHANLGDSPSVSLSYSFGR